MRAIMHATQNCHQPRIISILPPIFSDTDEPHQQTSNHLPLPTNQGRHRRQGQAPYFNVSARFNPGGPGARGARKRLLQSSSHHTMTKIYDLHLLKGVSSSSFYPSSPGAEPRATPSNTHMLARIPFAWANSLQFWLCTAKSTGMTDRRRRRQRPNVF